MNIDPIYPNVPESKLGGIYRLLNLSNSKVYIGSATILRERWYDHVGALRQGTHSNPYLQNAWNKYGESSFRFEIVEVVLILNKNNLEEREQYWLDYYKSYNDQFGYNICTKAYTKKGVPSKFKGIPRTEEVKEKIRIAKIGCIVSPESNKKRSDSMKGRVFTAEEREKLSLGAKRMWERRKSRVSNNHK